MTSTSTQPDPRPQPRTDRDRERKGWDSNATGRNAAAEPDGTAVLYR